MLNKMDDFNPVIESTQQKRTIRTIIASIVILIVVTMSVSSGGMKSGIILLITPLLVIFFIRFIDDLKFALTSVFVFNYFVLGLARYIPTTLGFVVDGMLILIYAIYFFRNFYKGVDFDIARTSLTLLTGIWFGYSLFQLLNPETASRVAWIYAVRGVSLYMLLTIPLTFVVFNRYEDMMLILKIWAILSILATLKGMVQLFIHPDPFEQAWLDNGGNVTHVLFGKLRVFSFFSDAGQFGASQGQAGVVFLLTALGISKKSLKIFFLVASLLALYGMAISGTRGAIGVPAGGFILFIVLSKRTNLMIAGSVALLFFFIFFKFTTIGNGNSTINRMRTGFDPNDPSLQVRLNNQKKFKTYLATRPFGGGIGSAGMWGERFSPGTLLATTATDSWYVAIWAEQGIVGLYLHLFILFFILIKGGINIWHLKNDEVRFPVIGLACGYFGIMVASYGNPIFGQMPTGITIYMSMVWLYLSPRFDQQITEQKAKALESNNPVT